MAIHYSAAAVAKLNLSKQAYCPCTRQQRSQLQLLQSLIPLQTLDRQQRSQLQLLLSTARWQLFLQLLLLLL
jgi:hypothetical protein